MAEAELLQQNLSLAEQFPLLMPNSEPTEMAGPKPHLLSGLLQHAHTREAWIAFSFSPVSPQGRNWEEKKVSLSYPTAKQQTPGLVVRSGHDPAKGWVLWTHQVMNARWHHALFHWAGPLQTCINHYFVLYWGFSNCPRIFFFFSALPAFDTAALEGAQSPPASSLLVAIWVVCERRLIYGTRNLEKNDSKCLCKAIISN